MCDPSKGFWAGFSDGVWIQGRYDPSTGNIGPGFPLAGGGQDLSIYIDGQDMLVIGDEYDPVLGTFLFLDIGYHPYRCLVALDQVAQIAQGRTDRTVVGGESVIVSLTPTHASLNDEFAPSRSRDIPFDEFRRGVEELWVVLYRANRELSSNRVYRPDLSRAEGDLVMWEDTFRQRHPYRGRIEGIPAQDPD
jgi:hypothetical protein